MQDVEVSNSSFKFRNCALRILRSLRGKQFQLDAETIFESLFELVAQHCCRRSAGDDFAFLLRRLNDFFPFICRIRRIGCRDEDKKSEKERAKDVEIK